MVFLRCVVILAPLIKTTIISAGRTSCVIQIVNLWFNSYETAAKWPILTLIVSTSVRSAFCLRESWCPQTHWEVCLMLSSLHWWNVNSKSASDSLQWCSCRPVLRGRSHFKAPLLLHMDVNNGCRTLCTLTRSVIMISSTTCPWTSDQKEERVEMIPSTGPPPFIDRWYWNPVVNVHAWVALVPFQSHHWSQVMIHPLLPEQDVFCHCQQHDTTTNTL